MIDYERELNESQLAAVQYCDGPSLVIAGAGSGKTRVLTFKIAWLLEHGYQPWSIMALTFTNKAAQEMKERIGRQVGDELASQLWMGTFHSLFAKILRKESSSIGFDEHFSIYDQTDSQNLLKTIIKDMELNENYKPSLVQKRISNAKSKLLSPEAYFQSKQDQNYDENLCVPKIHEVYKRYQERLKLSQAMDFDDLLMNTFMLFKEHPEVLERYRNRFKYVLVDEYQDTNVVQHSIVWQLTSQHQHVCAVGDDSQSIYSFRGANIKNILNFQKQYENVMLFKLERNYRSTQTIVNAANSLIENNTQRIQKKVYSECAIGEKIHICQTKDSEAEASYVAKQILRIKKQYNLSLNDFALLYRLKAQSRAFENELTAHKIAYVVYGGMAFYQRKEIKDIFAYLRILVNPNDGESFKRVFETPKKGIGPKTISKIFEVAEERKDSIWNVLTDISQCNIKIADSIRSKLIPFVDMIQDFRQKSLELDADSLTKYVYEKSGLKAENAKNHDEEEAKEHAEYIDELFADLNSFVENKKRSSNSESATIESYIEYASLLIDKEKSTLKDLPHVKLMTVHSAKGLEFNTVFVVGLEKNIFSTRVGAGLNASEEERRLFYVAITRAKERCFLTYPKKFFLNGRSEENGEASEFINEIPSELVCRENASEDCWSSYYCGWNSYKGSSGTSYGSTSSYGKPAPSRPVTPSRPTPSASQPSPSPAGSRRLVSLRTGTAMPAASQGGGAPSLHAGQHVEHERFGRGEVLSVSGEAENRRAVVRFDNAGEKTLLLKFARFRVLD